MIGDFNLKYLYFLIIILVIGFFIFELSNIVLAATFVEPFNSNTYNDTTNTDADWDIYETKSHLVNGKWVRADDTVSPYSFESVSIVTAQAFPRVITGLDGEPIIFFEDSSNGEVEIAKWTIGAGSSICGGGDDDCWTSMDESTAGLENDSLSIGNGFRFAGYGNRFLRLPDGTPAFAGEVSDGGGDYDLYYAQYTDGVGWTNADGVTSGAEVISNPSASIKDSTALSKYIEMKLDQYGEPTLVWNEVTGSGPYTIKFFYTRWNGLDWTYADRTTTGNQELISISQAATPNMGVELAYDSTGDIYVAVKSDNPIGSIYALKYDGANWTNLSGATVSPLPATSYSQFTSVNTGFNFHMDFDSSDTLYIVHSSFIKIGKWTGGSWKNMDGVTSGFETVVTGVSGLGLRKFSIDKDDNVIVWGLTSDEVYFTQWNGSDWVYSDGITSGAEQISTLTSGTFLGFTISSAVDANGYPLIVYADYNAGRGVPFYLTRYTGDDTKGGDKITNNQDNLIDTAEIAQSLNSSFVYYDEITKDIHVLAGTTIGDLFYTKLNAAKYPNSPQDLVSTTIATPHNSSSAITSATLTVEDTQPAGTSITYYLSADGGSNWCTATNGVLVNFLTCSGDVSGDDLRWKATLTTTSEDSSAQIEYLYVDVTGKTEGTSGDVTISASVEPDLTLTLSAATCNLGVFYIDKLTTCSYSATVVTNATSGYTVYIREDGELTHANVTDTITEVGGADNEITAAETTKEEYGVSTSQSGKTIAENTTGVTCANLDDSGTSAGNTSMPATALSASNQAFASAPTPASEETTLCHATSITGLTEAGTYSHTVTITVIGNF